MSLEEEERGTAHLAVHVTVDEPEGGGKQWCMVLIWPR
jgi:hypothetical protein